MASGHSTVTTTNVVTKRISRWRDVVTQAVLGALIGLGILWLTVSLVLPRYVIADVEGPPVMVAGPTSIDFGVVCPSSKLLGHVSVTNRGTRRLILREISEECSCVANPQASFVVPPGESLRLPVKFRVRGPSPTPLGSPEHFIVRFDTTDPECRILVVSLTAEVRSEHDQEELTPVEASVAASHVADR